MLTLTEDARACIRENFGGEQHLRRDISPRGCGTPVISLRPDVPDAEDRQLQAGDLHFLMRTSLCESVQSVLLDVLNGRFVAKLGKPLRVDGCGRCPASPMQGGTCGIIEGKNF